MNTSSRKDGKTALAILGRQWVLLFLLFEALYFIIRAVGFFSVETLQMIFFYGTEVFLLATAELFVIITGGIDLSVGYVMGFATVVSSKLMVLLGQLGVSPIGSILIATVITLLVGIIPGWVNGSLVARLKVPAFIATFSMLGVTHGISELLLQGIPAKNLPQLAGDIGNGYFIYYLPAERTVNFFVRPVAARGQHVIALIPNIVVLSFVFVGIIAFVLKRTKFGQHVYAIGGNIDAAIRAGINVKKDLIRVYILSSFFASLAGITYVLKYITGKADAGASLLLDSIAAVVIGGASMFGGSGTVWRTILGCILIATLETGLRMMGTPTFDKYIMVGIILVFAVIIERFFPDMNR